MFLISILLRSVFSIFRPHRDVEVDAQRSLFHVAVGGIDVLHDRFDGHGVGEASLGECMQGSETISMSGTPARL